ncbi:hypothetical protein AN1V17_47450 [Vallitalea sediminicola]
MKNCKGFIIGFLVACVLCTTTFVYADEVVRSIDVVLNSINICANNKKVAEIGESYNLSNGVTVPFSIMYKGTTYIPIRNVSEVLDKNIEWDQETRTVHINDIENINSSDDATVEKSTEEIVSNADNIKPTIVQVIALSKNLVEVTYSEEVDKISAEDITNYQIKQKVGSGNEFQIIKAELDDSKKKIVLTTKAHKSLTLYNIQVRDVVDLASNIIDDANETYVSKKTDGMDGISFITEGEFEMVVIETLDYNTINVIVNKQLDKKAAEDINNYIFKQKNESHTRLIISKAELDSTGTIVKLTTSKQESALYKARINGMIDLNGNKLDYESDRLILGCRPQISSNSFGMLRADATSITTVKVNFNFKVDEATISNLSNYIIYEKFGDEETYAKILDVQIGSDQKSILLTTSTLKLDTHYNVSIDGLKSIYGHDINNTPKYFGLY